MRLLMLFPYCRQEARDQRGQVRFSKSHSHLVTERGSVAYEGNRVLLDGGGMGGDWDREAVLEDTV